MAKFLFEMPDDMATLIEAFRVKRGHKATAQAVRELISTGLEVAGHLIGPIRVPAAPAPDLTKRVDLTIPVLLDMGKKPTRVADLLTKSDRIVVAPAAPAQKPSPGLDVPFGPVKRATPKKPPT